MILEDRLKKQIELEMNELVNMEAGTKEYEATVDTIAKLSDRLIDIQKNENRLEHEIEMKEKEFEIREKELLEQKKDRTIKHVMAGLGIGIPAFLKLKELRVFQKVAQATFEFEKEGTVTTIMGRGILNRIIPKK